MNLRTIHISKPLGCVAFIFLTLSQAVANSYFSGFATHNYKFAPDTSKNPIRDRYGDPYSNPSRNGFDFRDTAFIKRTVEYDPKTKQYYIIEKIGNTYYRTPSSFTMEEFLRLQGKKDEEDYFKKRAGMLLNMNRRQFKPKFKVSNDWFNRIMGAGPDGKVKIDIRPTGYVDFWLAIRDRIFKTPHCLKGQDEMADWTLT
ncbi:MAG: hypothetical protein IPM85_09230 [Chitinophagaceae bacterium]|nr:hypothetical protein [Chitinophagaceae bacterium]